jgi:hypothetical protein
MPMIKQGWARLQVPRHKAYGINKARHDWLSRFIYVAAERPNGHSDVMLHHRLPQLPFCQETLGHTTEYHSATKRKNVI